MSSEGAVQVGPTTLSRKWLAGFLDGQDVRVLLVGALASATVLGFGDVALLPATVRRALFAGRVGWLLPFAVIGTFLGWLAAAAAAALALRAVIRRLKHPRAAWFVAGALAAPIGWGLSNYLLSGPSVRHLKPHFLFVCVGAFGIAVISASSALPLLATSTQVSRQYRTWSKMFGLVLLAVAATLLNKRFLPNEYEPLHTFASGLALAATLSNAVLGGSLMLPRIAWRSWYSRTLLVAVLIWPIGAFGLVAKRASLAWAVKGESTIARYLPALSTDERASPELLATEKPRTGDSASLAQHTARARAAPPAFFLFFIDNVQADHVGAYGYRRRATTTQMDELAKSAALFSRAYSSFPQTRNYMTSLLTGRTIPRFMQHDTPREYQENSVTRTLKQRSYHVFIQGYFDQTPGSLKPEQYAIDEFMPAPTKEEEARIGAWPPIPTAHILERIEAHLRESQSLGKPSFVWVHLIGPHWKEDTFASSKEFPFGESVLDKYDSAIAESDQWLGRLRQIAKGLTDPSNTYWIVGSDHGAGLSRGETTQTGKSLYDHHVRVPLLIAGPGVRPGVYDSLVDSSLDVAATLLDCAGLSTPASYDGISLLPLITQGIVPGARTIPLHYGQVMGAVSERWKWIGYRGADQLYDTSRDPNERENLADSQRDVVSSLRGFTSDVLTRRIANYNYGVRGP